MNDNTFQAVWLARALIRWRPMCAVPAFMLVAGGPLLAADKPPPPDVHTFANQQGAKFDAVIINAVDGDVDLKLADGRTALIKINILSPADQDYVTQWAIKQVREKAGVFAFSLNNVESDVTTKQDNLTAQTTWQAEFKVTVKNLATVELTNLRAEYVIFYFQVKEGGQSADDGTMRHLSGSAPIDRVPYNGTQTFETAKTSLMKLALKPGVIYTNGGQRASADHLEAVWLRIYDVNGRQIQEWSSENNLTKDLAWESLYTGPKGKEIAPYWGARATPGANTGGRDAAGGNN